MCCIAILFGMSNYMVQAQINTGSILGYVYDQESKEGIPFTDIVVYQDDQQIKGTHTDFDGFFGIPALVVDTNYVITVKLIGYRTVQAKGCTAKSENQKFIELGLQRSFDFLEPLIVSCHSLETESEHLTKALLERKQYSEGEHRKGSYCAPDYEGQVIDLREKRDESTDIYIDGVKVRGNGMVPTDYNPGPPILNGTPAEIENNEAVPAATDPQ
jgi:hypothetical protein